MSDEDAGTNGDAIGSDSWRVYLNQIRRYPLLTRFQEIQLAREVAAGDPVARRRMIESNLRLVVAIARHYRSGGEELLELVQEGTLGLMRAVDLYDWRRETKFSTYAAWWIRHTIVRALVRSRQPIRLPDSLRARIAQVHRTEAVLTARLSRPPTAAEVATMLDLTLAQVDEARAAAFPVRSLDAPVDENGDASYWDIVADPGAPDPLQVLLDADSDFEIDDRLRQLPARSRRVIELRYGLQGGAARTAESVAQELGLARERVRQIELQTLRALATDTTQSARAA
jgi:RNA polymerase sigma factor (sigma-70 family)